jgi:hypothetical protein
MKLTFKKGLIERHYPEAKKNWKEGEVAEVLDEWAEKFIAAGFAEEGGKPKGTKVRKSDERPGD